MHVANSRDESELQMVCALARLCAVDFTQEIQSTEQTKFPI